MWVFFFDIIDKCELLVTVFLVDGILFKHLDFTSYDCIFLKELLFNLALFLRKFIFTVIVCLGFIHFINFLKFVQYFIVFFCFKTDKFQGTCLFRFVPGRLIFICQMLKYSVSAFVFQGFNWIFRHIPNCCFLLDRFRAS